MKLLGHILLACLVFAVLQALVALIALAIVMLLVWGLLFRTRATVGLIGFLLLLKALEVHTVATVCVFGAIGAALWIARTKPGRPTGPDEPIALPPPGEPPGAGR